MPCSAKVVSLKRIVDVLRVECPWDREQTPQDIVGYTVEEVHELADAIAGGDLHAEHGELGDLLLQVVLLALMLNEEGAGDLASVAHDIETKLIRRHPHIFADAVADTPAEVKSRWERIKVEQEGRQGIFHDVPAGFPALLYAKKLQQRAASVGFDWDSAAEAFPKIAEEHAELAELFAEAATVAVKTAADAQPADPHRADPRVAHEVGDLLFATVNVARLLHVDPELCSASPAAASSGVSRLRRGLLRRPARTGRRSISRPRRRTTSGPSPVWPPGRRPKRRRRVRATSRPRTPAPDPTAGVSGRRRLTRPPALQAAGSSTSWMSRPPHSGHEIRSSSTSGKSSVFANTAPQSSQE